MPFSKISAIGLVLSLSLLAACTTVRESPPISSVSSIQAPAVLTPQHLIPFTWQTLPGWKDDPMTGVAQALRENCTRLEVQGHWQRVCQASKNLDISAPAAVRDFFESHFVPFQLSTDHGVTNGLITGYYEPELRGSRTRKAPYLHALYRLPCLSHLSAFYSPSDKRQKNFKMLPPRGQLLRSGVLKGAELVYVDNPIDAFFLQIQGSGHITMEDGSVLRVGYGGSNGQPYRSIGSWLIEHGELPASRATMQGIKAWAQTHPTQIEALLAINPRFVFFKEISPSNSNQNARGPIGAMGIPLTPERSIAVDPTFIPLGLPVFLATTQPMTHQALYRLVFAQDVGAAIKGNIRADYFWGSGDEAGERAGKMHQAGKMWLLLPK